MFRWVSHLVAPHAGANRRQVAPQSIWNLEGYVILAKMSAYRHKHASKKFKTKRKTKDLDEIEADTEPENATKLLNQPVDYDVAGAAQFYCLHCARYFVDDRALTEHFRGKAHKRRLKDLENGQYTQEEADAAGGMGSYRAPKRRKFETQPYVEKIDPMNTHDNK